MCIDLRPWAEKNRYRWRYEDGFSATMSPQETPWFVEVVCHHGLIYPKGGNTLLAYTKSGLKREIRALPGVEHHQTDDKNEVFRFPLEQLEAVAALLKPKRLPGRAEPTEEQRAILKQHAFKAGQSRPE
jgi:hypothetical protein